MSEATTCTSVPKMSTEITFRDRLGSIRMRLGIRRNNYKVDPGVYAVGSPDRSSPVFVTANYKMSVDVLRRELTDLNVWILVIDTNGVNVWCAAGKGTFGTEELVNRIKITDLKEMVDHREVIVPQLGGPGVAAFEVKKESGFKVIYGPIRARDVKEFIANGSKTTGDMRMLTFTFYERLVLSPLELMSVLKPTILIAMVLLILSGFGPGLFSIDRAVGRWPLIFMGYIIGIISGAIVTPVLLPFIPVRAFSLKGAIVGLIFAALYLPLSGANYLEGVSILLISMLSSSYLALNFTGSTPFTSPSGVEKEMRRAIPAHVISIVVIAIVWIASTFIK
jgi:CO dehydrogenase/acetyl-CoA synthase delta subunit